MSISVVEDFINNNPFPKTKDISNIKKSVVKLGFTEHNIEKFYWEEMVKYIYNNLDDNEEITRTGMIMKFPKDIKVKDERIHQMALIINYFMLYKIVMHNYEKNKQNKTKYDKQLLLHRLNLIKIHWDRLTP